MIDNVTIKNYKSIREININLGRINVFIGANGSGKSNILEAIALGGAAAANKLDNEYLAIRGIRVANPRLMRNAFDISETDKPIEIVFEKDETKMPYELTHNNKPYAKWDVKSGGTILIKDLIDYSNKQTRGRRGNKAINHELIQSFLREKYSISDLEKFVIYSPENNELRKFEDENQLEPLGKYGEGLFKLVKSMDSDTIEELKSYLEMIDWFEDFYIEENLMSSEKKINLIDRFFDEKLTKFFDQRSANEGFLFLLFYLSLFISEYTPPFFAIDNVDNALNPKLCKDLIKTFANLSQKYDKQVILTTHNPAILDGLNLKDTSQKLYVVYRNLEGMTKIKEIDKNNFNVNGKVRLSEAFVRGYIGGLNTTLI